MATVLRPDGKIFKIQPKKKIFSRSELISLIGYDFEVIKLMSEDLLIVSHDFRNKELGRNNLATKFAHQKIHGTAIIVEPQEI